MTAQEIRDTTAALIEAERLGIPLSVFVDAAGQSDLVSSLLARVDALQRELDSRPRYRGLRVVRGASA